MNVGFDDADLEKLAFDDKYVGNRPPEIVKKFRRVVTQLMAFRDRRSIYAWKGFNFKKFDDAQGIYSIRLNKQWRLFIRFEKDGEKESAVIIDIGDPH